MLFPSCQSNLTIELTPVASYTDLPASDAVCHDKDVPIKPAVDFNPGGGSTIIFMRACMTVSILTPGFGLGLALPKTNSDRHQLISSTTFMNEPF
ncbi:putative TadE family protein [Roseibium sp. TrichSKD4]|nr:putative TadE family protein [Roseibium sp. TrichSKD4]